MPSSRRSLSRRRAGSVSFAASATNAPRLDTSDPHQPTNQQQGRYVHADCLPEPFDQLTLDAASGLAQRALQAIQAK
eukprot:12774366-Alexandrium_andersonii.AAC.1